MLEGGLPAGLDDGDRRAHRAARGAGRQALRRRRRPAARLGALGRRGLDAGDDGHDPEPRPERRGGRRARRARRATRASRATRTGGSSRCTARSSTASTASASSRRSATLKRGAACSRTSISPPTTSRELVETFKRDLRERDGRRVPAGPARAAAAVRSRGLRVVEHAARAGLPPRRTGSRTTSAPRSTSCRWCSATRATRSATGVCFTRDPSTGEHGAVRRVPRERAGRGRRRRHPHAASRSSGCASGCRRRTTQLLETMARLEQHYRDMQDIEFTVEDGHALPPADARGEAHRRGRAEARRSTWSTRA